MVDESQLRRSKAIHRRTGRTFYFATRLLPKRVRRATYVLYAFFRVADEVVDGEPAASLSPEEQRRRLRRIREVALANRDSVTDADADPAAAGDTSPGTQSDEEIDAVVTAFAELRAEVGIPDREVEVFIDAMITDIDTARYPTYDALEEYMRGSAAAVGEMMTAVMDPDEYEAARPHARALGNAFQLTNFLRDVREDLKQRDRIYLPANTLEEYGVTETQLHEARVDEAFKGAMEAELRRAEGLYRTGVAGIKYLPQDSQFAVLLAAVLYADHHRLIRERDYDVLTETPSLSTIRKTWLVCKTRWYWQWNRDPETVFAKVSAVPMTGADHRDPGRGDPQPAR